ncbi:MAG: C1 family peptidase [Bacteroidales bacterium]|nr:C1 family peptidase [Bacteroidales bacterium]HNW73123.1 C1 family peptidase [Bacteroidales bacterium]HPS50312.1 C1 family peptidase [Bacteroidales bacterium]
MKKTSFLLAVLIPVVAAQAQQPGTPAIMKESKPGYYQNTIMKDIRAVDESSAPAKTVKRFQADLSGMSFPNKVSLYQQEWRLPPVSQGNTNTCWCFSTTSFFESEVKRISGQEIKLSEMFTVYWEYVEKTRRFIAERGNSAFGEGSEANAVIREFSKYGAVPESAYTGLQDGRKFHTHAKMYNELKDYLEVVKNTNAWNEETVVATVRSIMDHYMGPPPESFEWNGKKYTPKEFFASVLRLQMDDYVDVLSYLQQPFWQKVEYEVPDNWWHSKEYYNVPLDDWMKALKNAIRNHYTLVIGGDVSEAGFSREAQVALVPTFDIAVADIDDNARQFRFSNETTTDDHGMHLVGWYEKDGADWFLIKDSGSGSRNNDEKAPEFGYYFFRGDYLKLKMMEFLVHKDAVKDLLSGSGK